MSNFQSVTEQRAYTPVVERFGKPEALCFRTLHSLEHLELLESLHSLCDNGYAKRCSQGDDGTHYRTVLLSRVDTADK